MTHQGALRRTAAVGLALATATTLTTTTLAPGVAAAAPHVPGPPRVTEVDPAIVPGRYIVGLKDDRASAARTRSTVAVLAQENGGVVRRVFTGALRGWSAEMTAAQAKRLATHPEVAYVEPVRRYKTSGTQTNPPSWGWTGSTSRTSPLNRAYTYPAHGDRGHRVRHRHRHPLRHQDFGGRASHGCDFIDGTRSPTTATATAPTSPAPSAAPRTAWPRTSSWSVSGCWTAPARGPRSRHRRRRLGDHPRREAGRGQHEHRGPPGRGSERRRAASIASGLTYAVAAGNGNMGLRLLAGPVPEAITVGATDKLDVRTT